MAEKSRQQYWQEDRLKEGRCPTCGKVRGEFYYCDQCHEKRMKLQRKRNAKKHLTTAKVVS